VSRDTAHAHCAKNALID